MSEIIHATIGYVSKHVFLSLLFIEVKLVSLSQAVSLCPAAILCVLEYTAYEGSHPACWSNTLRLDWKGAVVTWVRSRFSTIIKLQNYSQYFSESEEGINLKLLAI